MDVTGTIALGGNVHGVSIAGAYDNTIGGVTAADRNIISGNGGIAGVTLGQADSGNVATVPVLYSRLT
jgi:hypothetical protein